jgi:hypothetical protein
MSASPAPRRSAWARFLIGLGGLMLTPGLFVLVFVVGSFFGPHPFFQPDDPYADLVTSVLVVTLTITGAGLLLLICGLRERPAHAAGG